MNVTENSAHPVAPEEVMAFLDGEVSAERAEFLVEHVKDCSECKQVAEGLRAASQALSEWTVPAPQHLTERVKGARAGSIAKGGESSSGFHRVRELLSRGSVWAPALSLLVAVIAFAVWLPGRAYRHAQSKGHFSSLVELDPYMAKSGGRGGGGGGGDAVHGTLGGLTFERAEAGVPVPMIARSAGLTIVVNDFEGARAKMEAILARYHGYAANLATSNEPGSPRGLTASLRIPAGELSAALAEFKALGRVQYESQKGEEVTQQHADLVARLKNSRETEQRLQDVLRTRTGKVKDVLEVEEEIARVRGEIEQMEAEQKTLEHRVDFAAVELKLAEEYKAQLDGSATSVSRRLRNALVTGYKDAIESLVSLCLFAAEYGPILLLWVAILLLPTRWIWRRWRRAAAV